MTQHHRLFFVLSLLLFSSKALFAQNPDSIKAYIRELIEPSPNFALTYSTSSLSLEYVEGLPLTPTTEEFLEEQKEEYELTSDPMKLYLIAQTYRRMNRVSESEEWAEKAVLEIENLMVKYPDSIEIVENAYLIYLDNDQADLASLAAQMVTAHYQNSRALLTEAVTYLFTNQHDLGIETAKKGLLLYPHEAEWYMTKMIHEFMNKMNSYPIGSEEFSAKENRIDRSFLEEGRANYPDSLKIEVVSTFGSFFLFAYDEIVPELLNQLGNDTEVEGFEFKLGESLDEQLGVHFQKVMQLTKKAETKNWHSVYYTLGMIEMWRSEQKKAIAHFEKAINLMKPKYRQGQDNIYHYYDNMIMCHRILGDVKSAEKWVKRKATEGIYLDPVAAHYVEMGLYRAMDDDYKSALNLIDQAFKIDSSEIDAYSHKALILMLNDEMDEAFELFVTAELVDPNDIFTFKAVTLFHILKKNSDVATQLINQLEAYDPTEDFIADARRLLATE